MRFASKVVRISVSQKGHSVFTGGNASTDLKGNLGNPSIMNGFRGSWSLRARRQDKQVAEVTHGQRRRLLRKGGPGSRGTRGGFLLAALVTGH